MLEGNQEKIPERDRILGITKEQYDNRPSLFLNKATESMTQARFMVQNLLEAKSPIYQKDGALFRLELDDERNHGRFKLADIDILTLEVLKTTKCIKLIYDTDSPEPRQKEVNPPSPAIKAILSLYPCPFPEVNSILSHPTVDKNFNFVLNLTNDIHYDKVTKSLILPNLELNQRIEKINKKTKIERQEIREAIDTIMEPFVDFPMAEKDLESQYSILGFMYTLLMRPMFNAPVPMCMIKAPTQENGKTLLAEMMMLAILNENIYATPVNFKDSDETEKKLFAEFIEGPEVIFLDNIDPRYKIASSFIESAVTTMHVSDRILSQTATRKVYAGMPFIMTGINPRYNKDMASRFFSINLIQPEDDMSERTFKYDNPKEYIKEHRNDIIEALFIIFKNWIIQGMPKGKFRIGHFIEWSLYIGGIFHCIGYDNFLKDHYEFINSVDEENELMVCFLVQWWENYQDKQVNVSNLVDYAKAADLLNYNGSSFEKALGWKLSGYLGTHFVDEYNECTYEILRDGKLDNRRAYHLKRTPIKKKTEKK
jgi:predicted DNA-binding protein